MPAFKRRRDIPDLCLWGLNENCLEKLEQGASHEEGGESALSVS